MFLCVICGPGLAANWPAENQGAALVIGPLGTLVSVLSTMVLRCHVVHLAGTSGSKEEMQVRGE